MAAKSFRHLRDQLGVSQSRFAALLNVTVDTVRAIEQGRFAVSEHVARRAFVATGAIPMFLTLPDSLAPEAQAWTRQPYEPGHFVAWQRLTTGDIMRTLGGTDDQRFLAVTGAFFDAAKAARKLGTAQALVALALHDAAFELGIQNEARVRAHSTGLGDAFDFLATVAGRIQPSA